MSTRNISLSDNINDTIESLDHESKITLLKGESIIAGGRFRYRWTDSLGIRHSFNADTLTELRYIESQLRFTTQYLNNLDPLTITVNDIFELWKKNKHGVQHNTMSNYIRLYNQYVANCLGKERVIEVRPSTIKHFYSQLSYQKRIKKNTIERLQNVVYQVFKFAHSEGIIFSNPADEAAREVLAGMRNDKSPRIALSLEEETAFLNFIKNHKTYHSWYNLFSVMFGTGMRISEVCGLRWCDIDYKRNEIDINHALVQDSEKGNRSYSIHAPKTSAGFRQIPMLASVRNALIAEKKQQNYNGIKCKCIVDGYTDFVFLNRYGSHHQQSSVNRAIKRILADYGESQIAIPAFTCHDIRHTFATRLAEAGADIKFAQVILGHTDMQTTMNIYMKATKRMEIRSMSELEDYLSKECLTTASTDKKPA